MLPAMLPRQAHAVSLPCLRHVPVTSLPHPYLPGSSARAAAPVRDGWMASRVCGCSARQLHHVPCGRHRQQQAGIRQLRVPRQLARLRVRLEYRDWGCRLFLLPAGWQPAVQHGHGLRLDHRPCCLLVWRHVVWRRIQPLLALPVRVLSGALHQGMSWAVLRTHPQAGYLARAGFLHSFLEPASPI